MIKKVNHGFTQCAIKANLSGYEFLDVCCVGRSNAERNMCGNIEVSVVVQLLSP